MYSSVLDNLDTFFLTWWNQYNDSEVTSRELLPIAFKDEGFKVRYADLTDIGKRARIGAFLHNISRSGREVGSFKVLKERKKFFRLQRKVDPLPLEVPHESPFGWLPSPKEYPVLDLMRKMRSLGCSLEAITKALNEDRRLYRGKPWKEHLVEQALSFSKEYSDFVFRSGGPGPGVEANTDETSYFYMEAPSLGRVILRYNTLRELPKLACEKDSWIWRPVRRDGKVEGLDLPVAVQFWVCGCLQALKEASPQELAGVLDGLARKILQAR